MADSSREEFGEWPEEESGFYGEPADWFDLPDEPEEEKTADSPESEQEKLPEALEPPIHTYHENEPEEELATWAKEEEVQAVYDPFFDPDLPNIERRQEQKPEPEEEPGEQKSKKKPMAAFLKAGKQKSEKATEHNGRHEEKKRSRAAVNKKLLIYIAAGAACAVAAFFIVFALLNSGGSKKEPVQTASEQPEPVVVTENVSISTIRHLSFERLAVYETEGLLSVNEFSQILDNLYEEGYVLVDVYSIASADKDGNFHLSDHVEVPEGKTPLLISQRDVPDASSYEQGTFSDGLIITEDGSLHSSYTDADGNTAIGDLDVVPILESFLISHPDFSYNGARGIAALTANSGLIGTNDQENIISLMKERGWRFASNGYEKISYGSELLLIEEDARNWDQNIKPLTGDTDLIILPRKTDIGSWAPYSMENPKFALLYGLGFRYFFVDTSETPGFLQVESQYVRQAVSEIDSWQDYQDALDSDAV